MSIQPEQTTAIPGSSITASALIRGAMLAAHVHAAGEPIPGEEANDALVILNQMLDSWNADKLSVYGGDIKDFPLGTKQTYTLGPAGDFDTTRPAKIEAASILLPSNPVNEYPLELYTDQRWQEISLKAVTGVYPGGVYDDGAFPLRNLSFWPIPAGGTFRMYSWQALTQFTDLMQVLSFPPGYQEALKYNLAIRIAAEWPGELTQALLAAAQQSLAVIRSFNVEQSELRCDSMYLSGDCGRGMTDYAAFLKG